MEKRGLKKMLSMLGKVVTEVSKGALDNKDTDAKAGDKNDGKLL